MRLLVTHIAGYATPDKRYGKTVTWRCRVCVKEVCLDWYSPNLHGLMTIRDVHTNIHVLATTCLQKHRRSKEVS